MPARKPNGLITRARTKEESQTRASNESAMQAEGDVFARVPGELKRHTIATLTWKRLEKLFRALPDGKSWVGMLDLDLLVDYCLLVEQVVEMDAVRAAVVKKLTAKKKPKSLDDLAFIDDLVKLDARVDRKRALLLQLRQSLYLTPRARAGVVPEGKEPEPEVDPLEDLLEDVKM